MDYKASSSLIVSKSSGLNICILQSLFLYMCVNVSESSEADIKVHGQSEFHSKSLTVPICPMWFSIMSSSLFFNSSTYPLLFPLLSRSHRTMLSPLDARYLLLNGQNFTVCTFELCFFKMFTIGLSELALSPAAFVKWLV